MKALMREKMKKDKEPGQKDKKIIRKGLRQKNIPAGIIEANRGRRRAGERKEEEEVEV